MTADKPLPLEPKLRFPEFIDHGPWGAKPLDDLCDRLSETVGDAQLTPISISAGKGFVPQAEKFGRDISGSQYSKYIWLQRGDFAYNRGNSKRFPQGCVYQLTEFDEAAASSAFHCFRLHDHCEPAFVLGFFENNGHGRQLVRYITSGARSTGLLNINAGTFFGIVIPFPPRKAEQRKISYCLSSLDGLIAAEGRKLEALRRHKHGLMQRLFPQPGETVPRVRFPEFSKRGAWEETAIGNLGDVITGRTPLTSRRDFYGGDYMFVSPADISDLRFVEETKTTLTDAGFAECRRIKKNSVLFVCIGSTIGKVAQCSRPCATNQQINSLVVTSAFLADFVYYLLDRESIRIARLAGEHSVPIINKSLFAAVKVTAPAFAEQQRIADCLSSLDTRIAAQFQKLKALKTHKQGLLQQIFPSLESH